MQSSCQPYPERASAPVKSLFFRSRQTDIQTSPNLSGKSDRIAITTSVHHLLLYVHVHVHVQVQDTRRDECLYTRDRARYDTILTLPNGLTYCVSLSVPNNEALLLERLCDTVALPFWEKSVVNDWWVMTAKKNLLYNPLWRLTGSSLLPHF